MSRVKRITGVSVLLLLSCLAGPGRAEAGVVTAERVAGPNQAVVREEGIDPEASPDPAGRDPDWPPGPVLAFSEIELPRTERTFGSEAISQLAVRVGGVLLPGTDDQNDSRAGALATTSSVFSDPPRRTLAPAVRAGDLPPSTLSNIFNLPGQSAWAGSVGGVALASAPGDAAQAASPAAPQDGRKLSVGDARVSTLGRGPGARMGLVAIPAVASTPSPESFRTTLRTDPRSGKPGMVILDLKAIELTPEPTWTGPLMMFGTQSFRRDWDPASVLLNIRLPSTPILIAFGAVLGACALAVWMGILRTRAES